MDGRTDGRTHGWMHCDEGHDANGQYPSYSLGGNLVQAAARTVIAEVGRAVERQ